MLDRQVLGAVAEGGMSSDWASCFPHLTFTSRSIASTTRTTKRPRDIGTSRRKKAPCTRLRDPDGTPVLTVQSNTGRNTSQPVPHVPRHTRHEPEGITPVQQPHRSTPTRASEPCHATRSSRSMVRCGSDRHRPRLLLGCRCRSASLHWGPGTHAIRQRRFNSRGMSDVDITP